MSVAHFSSIAIEAESPKLFSQASFKISPYHSALILSPISSKAFHLLISVSFHNTLTFSQS